MNASFSQIAESIENAERILVASHVRPDGDALGSTIAFALWIQVSSARPSPRGTNMGLRRDTAICLDTS